jgi:hypothetical protein
VAAAVLEVTRQPEKPTGVMVARVAVVAGMVLPVRLESPPQWMGLETTAEQGREYLETEPVAEVAVPEQLEALGRPVETVALAVQQHLTGSLMRAAAVRLERN